MSGLDAHDELARAFRGVNIAMRRMRGRETHHSGGVSYAQFGLLFALEGGVALSARQLAEAASLSPASVTQMLEAMEAGGLVARTRSGDDKRVVLNALTERGEAAIAQVRARMEPAWREALAGFSDAQLRTAAAVLDALAGCFTGIAEDKQRAFAEPSDALGVGGHSAA
ncbi:MAG: MarR family transcriptional regulator [Acidobacteriota bacterium]|nr:MarR family transcriptional regulator [Acidobacteriota bacterium]